jgi:hypothetical protein
MAETSDLLPPLSTVCERLTHNRREHRRLRTLRRLILEAADEREMPRRPPPDQREQSQQ